MSVEKDSLVFVLDFVEIERIMRKLCDEFDHVVLLPIPNTTVEMLAKLLTERLCAELRAGGARTHRGRDGGGGELRSGGDVQAAA